MTDLTAVVTQLSLGAVFANMAILTTRKTRLIALSMVLATAIVELAKRRNMARLAAVVAAFDSSSRSRRSCEM
jgi:hypothetical protein